MVADFSWIEYTNSNTTGVPTNLNLGNNNSRDLAPSTYPITAGTYSYSKYVKALWSGSFTRIENLQFWMSGSGSGYVGGETLWTNATDGTWAGSTYTGPTTNEDGLADNAMPIADPGTANIGIGGSLSGSIVTSTAPDNDSDFIVVQASITSGASAGAVQQKTFTIQYDEV